MLFGFIALFIYACETTDVNPGLDMWPMQEGNYWTFQDSSYYGSDWRVDTVTWSINGKFDVEGITYYTLQIIGGFNECGNGTVWLYRNEGNDLIHGGAVSELDTLFQESIYIRDTERQNSKWEFHEILSKCGAFGHGDTLYISYTDNGQIILNKIGSVNYKKFKYNYVFYDSQRSKELYFSKGIGPVQILSITGSKIMGKRKLIDYNIE